MVLGCEIELPVNLLYPPPPGENVVPFEEFVVKLKIQMENVHEVAMPSLLEAGGKQKRLSDGRVSKHQYNLADAVWLRNYTRPKGLSKKLMMRWDGPFKIL